ncbi:DUF6082 family protein [Actinoplanes sp. CA-030573]|uniref:DUF6082 family protein n=1 Tax=Actinoplanes sp. CA-030573 TaxID=3239898 RepID=UPI003D928F04
MSLPPIPPRNALASLLSGAAKFIFALAGLGLIAGAILVSPAVLRFVQNDESDWHELGDIGQAYGPVSALLAALALCVAVLVQHRQLRQEHILRAREMHSEALRRAMDNPAYCQCWGPRVSPETIDERLFYQTSSIITSWMYSWHCGDLSDNAVRSYVRAMAGSEVPRAYWRMHGAWRLQAARGWRARFYRIVDTEFRLAEAAGAPERAAELFRDEPGVAPATGGRSRARRLRHHRAAERVRAVKSRH